MTPKEKAIELINKNYTIIGGINSKDWEYFHGKEAKELSLIAVNEMVKVCIYYDHSTKMEFSEQCRLPDFYFASYWEMVKQEIEKL